MHFYILLDIAERKRGKTEMKQMPKNAREKIKCLKRLILPWTQSRIVYSIYTLFNFMLLFTVWLVKLCEM